MLMGSRKFLQLAPRTLAGRFEDTAQPAFFGGLDSCMLLGQDIGWCCQSGLVPFDPCMVCEDAIAAPTYSLAPLNVQPHSSQQREQ